MSHLRIRILFMGVVALGLGTHHAQAQTAGNYVGTTADGNNISFTVSDDGNGGLEVTSLGYGLTTTCHPGSSTFSTGWSIGASAEITSGAATYVNEFGYLYTNASFKFRKDMASGTLASSTPTFAPYTGSMPKQAVFCTSPKQTFTATLSTTSSAMPRQKAGTATLLTTSSKPAASTR